jgi:protein-L-isoaspartate(D-aspartate) O-methyltransferase
MSDAPDPTAAEHGSARQRMIERIELHFRDTVGETGEPGLAPRVRRALENVPRHEFVPESTRDCAYLDGAFPIGSGQTISQPFIVALMTQLARVETDSRVLEIGTGCGYQTAILAEIAERVHTIERVPELAERARATLARLGYDGIAVRTGDGWAGWPEDAPFDVILVTAAASEVPSPLLEQLAPGGRMVVPVSSGRGFQDLLVLTKDAQGHVERRSALPVAFVPLVHEEEPRAGDPLG